MNLEGKKNNNLKLSSQLYILFSNIIKKDLINLKKKWNQIPVILNTHTRTFDGSGGGGDGDKGGLPV